jgi:hypothetical protein
MSTPPAADPIEEARDRILAWLIEAGLPVELRTMADTHWAIVLTAPQPLIIVQPQGWSDHVLMRASITVQNADKIKILPIERQRAIQWEILKWLLSTRLGFEGVDLPFRQITLQREIFYDGITKDRLMGRLRELQNAVLFVAEMLERTRGEMFNPDPSLLQG